jgi:hypothetical protein
MVLFGSWTRYKILLCSQIVITGYDLVLSRSAISYHAVPIIHYGYDGISDYG